MKKSADDITIFISVTINRFTINRKMLIQITNIFENKFFNKVLKDLQNKVCNKKNASKSGIDLKTG